MLKKTSFLNIINKSLLYIYLIASITAWIFVDKSVSDNSDDPFAYQFYLLYIFGFLTSRIVVRLLFPILYSFISIKNAMQIAHLCRTDFSQFQLPVVFFTLILNAWTIMSLFMK